jgi:exodeoxyribonuclease V alpha subunit
LAGSAGSNRWVREAEAWARTDILPASLCLHLHQAEVAETTMWVGHELAASCAASPLDVRRAVAFLAMALATAMEAGSVHLPLEPAELMASLERLVGASGTPPGEPLPLPLVESAVTATLALGRSLRDGTIPTALAHLFGTPGARTPMIVGPRGLYAERIWRMEERVSRHLRARLRAPEPNDGEASTHGAAAAAGPSLTDEQRQAVALALSAPLALVTGGPGTGKTSSVVALLRALVARGVRAEEIALAAPTGRAAQRLSESIRSALAAAAATATFAPAPASDASELGIADATTLHRLIGIGTERLDRLDRALPTFHAGWRLPRRVVIVDEASMIDLPLMDALLEALPAESQLVLLGDADQLPSVELGAVFRDLVAEAPARAVARLTRSHRAGAGSGDARAGNAILAAASAINQGTLTSADVPSLFRPIPDPHAAGFRGTEMLAAAFLEPVHEPALESFLATWWRTILHGAERLSAVVGRRFVLEEGRLVGPGADEAAAELTALLQLHARARVLCLARQSPWEGSTAAVNRSLHRLCRRAAFATNPFAAQGTVVPGAPVIFLSNDYGRGLFNGDIGVVVRATAARASWDRASWHNDLALGTRAPEALQVVFARPHSPDGLLSYPFEDLRARLELAFALTVHKAQGSEYDHVALVLPPRDTPLLSREILYTALTRARHGAIVIGDPALLVLGASRPRPRSSGLDLTPSELGRELHT